MLRVSHFKPWKDSTNEERLDAFNALLLCCNHDALYDKGLLHLMVQARYISLNELMN
ncbi:HNH endonuclease [Lysinibacillus sphaericus]|uniref:HNH endonuclease n=1 Tax=Lysinibacillus sphaericus TaxID=1421 RepID=UPI002103627B|nr:HNH endonuclease [Lysinibacillus sp. SDF0037]